MSAPPDLGTILTDILNAVQSVIGAVASAIASNAGTIGTVIVLGALTYLVVRYGARVFRNVTGWLSGLF